MQQALINSSKRLTDLELACIAEAVNEQIIECAKTWGYDSQVMTFYSTAKGLPAANCRIMDVVDTVDLPGASGYHTNEFGVIYGRVLAQAPIDTGITTSHEGCEMLIDPSCARWREMPDGFEVALEVSDPVQGDAYPVNVTLAGLDVTRTVLLSNYVLPSWFDPNGKAPFDRMGRLTEPLSMSPGGYMIVRDPNGKQGFRFAHVRFGGDMGKTAFASKFANPDGRMLRRLAAP